MDSILPLKRIDCPVIYHLPAALIPAAIENPAVSGNLQPANPACPSLWVHVLSVIVTVFLGLNENEQRARCAIYRLLARKVAADERTLVV